MERPGPLPHRVLHFLWSGELGGAERAVYQLVREQIAHGDWEVGVAFGQARGPWARNMSSLGCEIIDLHMGGGTDVVSALRAVPRLRRYDLHHFHVLEIAYIVASARCPGVARVFTQRHGRQPRESEPFRKTIRRLVSRILLPRYLHAVSGNTNHALTCAIRQYGLEAIPGQVTYNGLDFSLMTPQMSRVAILEQLGTPPGAIVVGSSGTLKGWKRFDYLIDLLAVRPDLHVLLVGDGKQRKELEARAQSLGAARRLHITGLVENVADYLQAMDIFVLPSSDQESFGNAVVEAMGMGIPSVVFADSPGLCEHIVSGVTGFIVRDVEELHSTIRMLCTAPLLRDTVGSAAAAHVRSVYTLHRAAEAYRKLYQTAMGQAAKKRKGTRAADHFS